MFLASVFYHNKHSTHTHTHTHAHTHMYTQEDMYVWGGLYTYVFKCTHINSCTLFPLMISPTHSAPSTLLCLAKQKEFGQCLLSVLPFSSCVG